MFVRASTITADPSKADEGTRFYRDQMVPAIKETPGFLGALLLIDRPTGKSLGLTFWETQEALKASEDAANKLRSQGVSQVDAQPPTVERFEVAYYGVPEKVYLELLHAPSQGKYFNAHVKDKYEYFAVTGSTGDTAGE